MFSFLTERPRSAHKALQDAFAYLIVLKHKARAGELGWELANDFDEHKEVWTSIRDLIKVNKPENVLPSFASLSSRQRLQSLELLDREARGCRDFGAARLPCTWPSTRRWRLLRRSATAVHMALCAACRCRIAPAGE
jgi:hypothetical protein